MDSKVVAFDPGFQFTKGYSEQGKYICLARVVEAPPTRQPHEGVNILEIEGKKYQVGDGLKNAKPDLNHDKTFSMKTKVEMMNYLHQICDGERGSFTIITGTPLSKSETAAGLDHALIDYLSTGSEYKEVIRNNVTKDIRIDHVYAMPQAFITYFGLPAEERARYKANGTTVLIWDLGGHTFDVAEFVGGVIQKDPETKLFTRNSGIIPMLEKFRKKLDYRYPTIDFPSSEQLRKIFEEKKFNNSHGVEDVTDLVDEVAREHVRELIQDMSLVFNPQTADENLLCGGGFVTLAPYIQEVFPNAKLIHDAQFTNVKSMYTVAVDKLMYARLMVNPENPSMLVFKNVQE